VIQAAQGAAANAILPAGDRDALRGRFLDERGPTHVIKRDYFYQEMLARDKKRLSFYQKMLVTD
jgi:hypothetical protein